MTETMEKAAAFAAPHGGRDMAREMTEEERAHGLRCVVRHPDAGGECGRGAGMLVYGLAFCEVHGEEARVGALSELYRDAANFLGRLDNDQIPAPNPAALSALRAAVSELDDLASQAEKEEWPALRRAYPTIPERVCSATVHHNYGHPGPTPLDTHLNCRQVLHELMRRAYEEQMDWLVETLEVEREQVSAQAAFALEHDGLGGEPRLG
jgi:hypothetical protein